MADAYKYVNSGRLSLFNTPNKTGTQYSDISLNRFGPSFSQENPSFAESLPTGNKEFWLKDRVCFHILNYKTDNNNTAYTTIYINQIEQFGSLYYITKTEDDNSVIKFMSANNLINLYADSIIPISSVYGAIGGLLYPTGTVHNGNDLYSNYTNGSNINIQKNQSSASIKLIVYKNSNIINTIILPLEEQINFELHVKSDATAGIVELFINSKLVFTYTGEVLNGEDISSFYIGGRKTDTCKYIINWAGSRNQSSYYPIIPLHSSIILQNTERIGAKQIIEVPAKSIDTDWVLQSDGSYMTDTEGKNLLQVLDNTKFKSNINTAYNATGNYKLTGIAVQAENTLNANDTDLKNVKVIVKKDGVITEGQTAKLGTVGIAPLLTQPMSKNIITNSDWDIDNDLSTTKFGIKSSK